MRYARLIVLASLLAAPACERQSPAAPGLPFSRQVTLAPGQAVSIDEASLSLRFVGVIGDSRCPATGICVWAGNAVARVLIEAATGSPATYDLRTDAPDPTRHADLSLELVQVSPYPATTSPIPPAEYRATLRVRRQ
jgi:hypothetical protein